MMTLARRASVFACPTLIATLLAVIPGIAAPGGDETRATTLAAMTPSGRLAVGRRMEVWRDESRPDPVDPSRQREVPITIWYPAAAAAGAAAPPLPGTWADRHLEAVERRFGAPIAAAMRDLRAHARTDAPVAAGPARFPIVLFTPGLGWLATDYTTLVEDLTSHGYVVVGLSPVGFADVVELPGGRVVTRTLGNGAAIGVDQAHVHADALFVLQRLRALDAEPASVLHGRLDLTRIGALGHSLGGTTAHMLAARDPQVRAAANIDGDPMGAVVEIRPRQPLLLVSSGTPVIDEAPTFPSEEHRARVEAGLARSEARRTADWQRMSSASSAAYRIRLRDARHTNFVDVALFELRLTAAQERWQRVGPITGARALVVTREIVRAFFDHTLRGADDALLRAPETRFPEARREVGPVE